MVWTSRKGTAKNLLCLPNIFTHRCPNVYPAAFTSNNFFSPLPTLFWYCLSCFHLLVVKPVPFPSPSLSLFALLTPLCLLLLSFGLSLPLSIHVFPLDCLLHLCLLMFVVLSCSLWGILCEGRNVKSLNSWFLPLFFSFIPWSPSNLGESVSVRVTTLAMVPM